MAHTYGQLKIMEWLNTNEAVENEWYVLLIGADISHKKPYVRTGITYYFSNGSFWHNNTRVNESILKCFALPLAPINEDIRKNKDIEDRNEDIRGEDDELVKRFEVIIDNAINFELETYDRDCLKQCAQIATASTNKELRKVIEWIDGNTFPNDEGVEITLVAELKSKIKSLIK